MKDLHKFLGDNLGEHQKRIRELRELSKSVARMLEQARRKFWYWPYSCSVTDDKLKPLYPDDAKKDTPSISTQAMICASIDRVLLRDRDHRILADEERKNLETSQSEVETEVLKLLDGRAQKYLTRGKPFLDSSTFGQNDVFTASWLLKMYKDQEIWDQKHKDELWTPRIKRSLVKIIERAIQNKQTRYFDYEKGLFTFGENKSNEAGPHSLPLLKVINALEIIKSTPSFATHWRWRSTDQDRSLNNAIRLAGDWLEKNLHRQMSFYQFKDFRFDAAELIFCFYGSIRTGRITAYETIVDNVLQVVREAQGHSVYWRPYRPMTSSSQGGVLLPLSIEVAVALLRTLQETKKFREYADTLEQYFKWLHSQRLSPSEAKEGEISKWVGWHSENAYEFKVIHVWCTALIGAFLCDLLEAKDVNFQEDVLEAGYFTVERPGDKPDDVVPPVEKLISPDLGLKTETATSILENEFNWKKGARPRKFSLLIYGPPGTSKTTLGKAVAKSLDWPLVYLSPSNFITSGEAGIEQQAKDIFDALICLRRKVIFFDEIDRLILDRDSRAYEKQGDMFQFMTPSMLTKINDLREAKRSIFIIATNYEEHIDAAIKREGRIDKKVPWLPMDLQARTAQFKELIDKSFKDKAPHQVWPRWPAVLTASLKRFAKRCPLMIYPEMKKCISIAEPAASSMTRRSYREKCVKGLLRLQKSEIPRREVLLTFMAYRKERTKAGDSKFLQKAYFEYACLLMLLGQGETKERRQARVEFKNLMNDWRKENQDDYESNFKEVERRIKAYGLGTWL